MYEKNELYTGYGSFCRASFMQWRKDFANNSRKKVFISYSWPSKHSPQEEQLQLKNWIVQLKENIELAGVQVIIDQTHLKIGIDMLKFMEEGVDSSDYIIAVYTPLYKEKSKIIGTGVNFEIQQIIKKLDKSPGCLIGIVKEGGSFSIPDEFKDLFSAQISNSSYYPELFKIVWKIVGEGQLPPFTAEKKLWMKGRINPEKQFIGREKELDILDEKCTPQEKNKRKVFQVYGTSGVGKSQLVSNFVEFHQDRFSLGWWINCETIEEVRLGLVSLSKNLALIPSESDPKTHITELTQSLLSESLSGWVLIFDNISSDVAHEILDFIPAKGGIAILTSRDPISKLYNYVGSVEDFGLRLEPLSLIHALQLLRVTCKISERNDVFDENDNKKIVNLLDRNPLAIEQAGLYMFRNNTTATSYLKKLESESKGESYMIPFKLWIDFFTNYTTEDNSYHPISVLQKVSYLGPDNIPFELLVGDNSKKSDKLFNYFLEYSLVSVDKQKKTISVQRLIKKVLREVCRYQSYGVCIEEIQCIQDLAKSFSKNLEHIKNTHNKERASIYLSHCQSFWKNLKESERKLPCMKKWIKNWILVSDDLGHYRRQVPLLDFLLENFVEKENGEDELEFLEMKGNVYTQLLKTNASEFYEKALSIAMDIYEKEKVTKNSMARELTLVRLENSLGVCWYRKGCHDLAIKKFELAIEKLKDHSGDYPALQASCLNNIANSKRLKGLVKESILHLDEAIEITKIYNSNSYELSKLYNDKASSLKDIGKIHEALDYYFLSLEIKEKYLISNSLQIGTVKNNLGHCYCLLGEYDKAKELILEGQRIYKNYFEDGDISLNYPKQYLANIEVSEGIKKIELDPTEGKKLVQKGISKLESVKSSFLKSFDKFNIDSLIVLVDLVEAYQVLNDTRSHEYLKQIREILSSSNFETFKKDQDLLLTKKISEIERKSDLSKSFQPLFSPPSSKESSVSVTLSLEEIYNKIMKQEDEIKVAKLSVVAPDAKNTRKMVIFIEM